MAKRRGSKSLPPPPPLPGGRPYDVLAHRIAGAVGEAHGADKAMLFNVCDELGQPKGWVKTGNIALDRALGGRGFPLGRISEIAGWERAGKSTMVDQCIAQAQRDGGVGALVDTERARDRAYMTALGVNPDTLVWMKARSLEEVFEEAEVVIRQVDHVNTLAWVEALRFHGMKVSDPPTRPYRVYSEPDARGVRRVLRKLDLAYWDREQMGVLSRWQQKAGLTVTGMRDTASREVLRPGVLGLDPTEYDCRELMEAHYKGETSPWVTLADRPVVMGWDSIALTGTEAEVDGTARDTHVAPAAKIIRYNLRRLVQLMDDVGVALLVTNQFYSKLGGLGSKRWGAGEDVETYGGGGMKYASGVRVEVQRSGAIKRSSTDQIIGQTCRLRVIKSRLGGADHRCEYALLDGRGAVDAYAIFEDLKERGIIRQSGSWAGFEDTRVCAKKFQGWTGLEKLLKEEPPETEAQVRALYMEGIL